MRNSTKPILPPITTSQLDTKKVATQQVYGAPITFDIQLRIHQVNTHMKDMLQCSVLISFSHLWFSWALFV